MRPAHRHLHRGQAVVPRQVQQFRIEAKPLDGLLLEDHPAPFSPEGFESALGVHKWQPQYGSDNFVEDDARKFPKNRQNGRATRESSGSLTQTGLRKLDNETQLHTQSDRNKKKAFDELDKLAHNLNLRVLLVRRTEHVPLKRLKRPHPWSFYIRTDHCIALCGYPRNRRSESGRRTASNKRCFGSRSIEGLSSAYERTYYNDLPNTVKSISQIASKIGLSEKVTIRAIDILNRAKEYKITEGKNPKGLAASALLVSSFTENENKKNLLKESSGIGWCNRSHCSRKYKELSKYL